MVRSCLYGDGSPWDPIYRLSKTQLSQVQLADRQAASHKQVASYTDGNCANNLIYAHTELVSLHELYNSVNGSKKV